MTPEGKLYQQVKKALDAERGIWWFKVHGSPQQKKGIPDLCIIVRGRALFVELKADGKKATKLQEHAMKQIRSAGGAAMVSHNVDTILAAVRKMNEEE